MQHPGSPSARDVAYCATLAFGAHLHHICTMPRFRLPRSALVLLAFGCAVGCQQGSAKPTPAAASAAGQGTPAPILAGASAEVGKPAPDFTLPDLDGKLVKLSDYKGKRVVLEWFNPQCPFVKAAHGKGSLMGTARRHAERGVVWLAINSGAPGKQGHGVEVNRNARQEWSLEHPILLDESGAVGRAYGAKTTPHLFVIDEKGTLVYAGAIDNSPDGEGKSPADGKLVNHVDAALEDLAAGRPVAVPTTKPYGCSVKYGST